MLVSVENITAEPQPGAVGQIVLNLSEPQFVDVNPHNRLLFPHGAVVRIHCL